jgi:hypothetical protein
MRGKTNLGQYPAECPLRTKNVLGFAQRLEKRHRSGSIPSINANAEAAYASVSGTRTLTGNDSVDNNPQAYKAIARI